MSEVVIRVPRGVDPEKVKRRIEAILDIVASDELDRFVEFLEDELDVYTEEDIEG